MKQYLLETFKYNNWANTKLLQTIQALPDAQEPIRLFSHLITSQNKWMNRITKVVDDSTLNWFSPVYAPGELAEQWKQSIGNWIDFIEKHPDTELENMIEFIKPNDGKILCVKIKDVALQLNYHSIHHRAQINTLISKQGQKPPLTDYIFTALKEK